MKRFLILIFLSIPIYCNSTTIIISINLNKIIIGSDSKESSYEMLKGDKSPTHISYSACKILRLNEFVYCEAGNRFPGIRLLLNNILDSKADIKTKINQIKAMLYSYIPLQLERIRLLDRRLYSERTSKKYFYQIALCYFERNLPFVYQFKLSRINPVNQKSKLKIDTDRGSNGTIIPLGQDSLIAPLIKNQYFIRNGLKGKTISDSMIELINMEIKRTPSMVGLPISVLELSSKQEPYWIYRGVCKW